MDEFELESIQDDAEEWKKFIGELLDQDDKKNRFFKIDRIVVSCPMCGGSGYTGHDREYPPNPYICRICDGSGKVEIKPFKDKKNED